MMTRDRVVSLEVVLSVVTTQKTAVRETRDRVMMVFTWLPIMW